jgi:hypothetical protein
VSVVAAEMLRVRGLMEADILRMRPIFFFRADVSSPPSKERVGEVAIERASSELSFVFGERLRRFVSFELAGKSTDFFFTTSNEPDFYKKH